MALFTDSNISSLSDLQAYDSAILEVSRIEGVDLTKKLSLAEQEIGLELQAFLLRYTNGSSSSVNSYGYGLNHVVVTSGLQQWHSLKTLGLVYGDVYNSQLNDRYLGKWKQFVQLARNTSELLLKTGVGVVARPIDRAAAPLLSVNGGGGAGASFVVSIAWRNVIGERGAPSEATVQTTSDGEALVVTAGQPPASAVTFDVYVGLSEFDMGQQNNTTVSSGANWIMPAGGLVEGEPPGAGQTPDRFLRLNRTLQRG
ncbi:MAG: hypothetical protein JJE04_16475 [Acidobacteriia bacterium]|nr:hypothetical protein [Terriglobia bacterium]